jgi:hypothetical protein
MGARIVGDDALTTAGGMFSAAKNWTSGSGEKALNSFVVGLHEGLLGRYPGYPLTYTDPGDVLCAPILVLYP